MNLVNKVMEQGAQYLTDHEIISLIIGSGNKSSQTTANMVLEKCNEQIENLHKISLSELSKIKGLGPQTALKLVASIELGKRRIIEETKLDKIQSSISVFDIMKPLIGDLENEEFWILYLNNSNKVICKKKLSIGGITGTIVDVRLVLKYALEFTATAIVLCHNHPSGTLKPSQADESITQKIKIACGQLDIKLLDHLIVTQHSYFSFADENKL